MGIPSQLPPRPLPPGTLLDMVAPMPTAGAVNEVAACNVAAGGGTPAGAGGNAAVGAAGGACRAAMVE